MHRNLTVDLTKHVNDNAQDRNDDGEDDKCQAEDLEGLDDSDDMRIIQYQDIPASTV